MQAAAKEKVRKLRAQFFDDLRRQLYTAADDRAFFADIQASLVTLSAQLEQGQVAILYLEQNLLNVTCDDPGAALGLNVVLPLLQDRLDDLAAEHAAREADRVQAELLQQTVRAALTIFNFVWISFFPFVRAMRRVEGRRVCGARGGRGYRSARRSARSSSGSSRRRCASMHEADATPPLRDAWPVPSCSGRHPGGWSLR